MDGRANDGAKPVVLVVDDSPEYLSLMGELLESSYDVRVAKSGERALQLARQEPHPDLVLLDVLMPDMDGHAVLSALRRDQRTREIPVIFFTSLEAESEELAGLSEGAADYIVKPAAPALVQARVRAQIELKQMRDRLRERNDALQDEVERRKRLEQALQHTIADLDAFSYIVSHDLRAPLDAISAFAAAVVESDAHTLSDRGKHRLERIAVGSRRMNMMIDDILLYSRSNRSQMCLQTVDLAAMVADVVAQMGDEPATRFRVGALPPVCADPAMLRQVLANLIGNARKFSSVCADAQVEVEARTLDGVTEVTVRDNGAGFDMAYRDKLFGLFQRLHGESEFPGTGVGLAIVKRLVARQGGTVAAESVPGGWTTFRFTLPARRSRRRPDRCGTSVSVQQN